MAKALLKENKSKAIAQKLNELLANYHIHYQRARNFHWNIKGDKFFELHLKFEEFYTDALLKIDEIAERVLTLKEKPMSSLQEYIDHATLKESKGNIADTKMVEQIINDFDLLIGLEKEIFRLATDAGDDRTADQMNGYIALKEKNSWMLNSWLGN